MFVAEKKSLGGSHPLRLHSMLVVQWLKKTLISFSPISLWACRGWNSYIRTIPLWLPGKHIIYEGLNLLMFLINPFIVNEMFADRIIFALELVHTGALLKTCFQKDVANLFLLYYLGPSSSWIVCAKVMNDTYSLFGRGAIF